MKKILYFLIGPKGSGKTHIGAMADHHTGIRFIPVEAIWLNLAPGEDGWARVEAAVDESFRSNKRVMIESLGAGEGFERLRAALSSKYDVRMVRVKANPETCLARVKQRDAKAHLPASDEQVAAYNRVAARVIFPWVLEIENDPPASDAELVAMLKSLE